MNWLVVLDPIDGLLAKTDTSIALIQEARRQGLNVDLTTIDDLFFETEAAAVVTTDANLEKKALLRDYDIIFMRKEPPYDLAFHYATQLLSLSNTLVVNSPASLRSYNEKLIALQFPDYMPPTLVSSTPELLGRFIKSQGPCIIKALDSFQGRSVQKIDLEDSELIGSFTAKGSRPVMVQKFLDRVYDGDKRVIMLGDSVLGAALRKPKTGYHANFASSTALKTALTAREQEIVAKVGPWLVNQGIYFSGLDFIGEQLTEINITCPTGIIQISELDGTNLVEVIVKYFIELQPHSRKP
ncbi:MAG: ATP-grasp domain-containing protein [Desulforhopalus sp.]